MIDAMRQRTEFSRWLLLLSLNNARPVGAWEEVLLSIMQAMYVDATMHEIRRELDYLAGRGLIAIQKHPHGRWFSHITDAGVDVAEYTVDVNPGIARPRKY